MEINTTFIEIKFLELKTLIKDFIRRTYDSADEKLSPADPYGQLLETQVMVIETDLLYMKNIVSQFEINNVNNNNKRMIDFTAIVAGYNPGRALSASGTLSLILRPGVDINEEIIGSEINIYNGTKITSKTNNLNYFVDLGGSTSVTFKLTHSQQYFLSIVQGNIENQTRTGSGLSLQTYSIDLPNDASIEEFRIIVSVNGESWTIKKHLYDMLSDEKSCWITTGVSGGIDVHFGTSDFGLIPSIGSEIKIVYVVSDGNRGNIAHKLIDDWTFVDDILDGVGGTVDIETNFNVIIHDEVSMGGNAETPEFTRAVLPYTSRNMVLVRPEQYIFHLKRLNQFLQIDAFTTEKNTTNDNEDDSDDSTIYIFLIPDYSLYLTGGNSYFDLDLSAFYLENSQKLKIELYLKTQGIVGIGNIMKILDPIITRYTLNIYLKLYNDAIEDNVRSSILKVLSTYFGKLTRTGIIAKSDIIDVINNLDGVVSVSVSFISELNEQYHLNYVLYKQNIMKNNPQLNPNNIIMQGYEPNKIIGLDPILGDIIYSKNELPIIRGSWQTRDKVFYEETPQIKGFSSVNIFIDPQTQKRTVFN